MHGEVYMRIICILDIDAIRGTNVHCVNPKTRPWPSQGWLDYVSKYYTYRILIIDVSGPSKPLACFWRRALTAYLYKSKHYNGRVGEDGKAACCLLAFRFRGKRKNGKATTAE